MPPGEEFFRISVKAGTKTALCPAFFCTEVPRKGPRSKTGPPCGEFLLDLTERHERPLMLLSAGVGITPLLSMLLGVLQDSAGAGSLFRSRRI